MRVMECNRCFVGHSFRMTVGGQAESVGSDIHTPEARKDCSCQVAVSAR
jgi:hypothetical protein